MSWDEDQVIHKHIAISIPNNTVISMNINHTSAMDYQINFSEYCYYSLHSRGAIILLCEAELLGIMTPWECNEYLKAHRSRILAS